MKIDELFLKRRKKKYNERKATSLATTPFEPLFGYIMVNNLSNQGLEIWVNSLQLG